MAPKLPRRVAAHLADRYDPSAEGPFQHAVRGLALALEESNDGRVPTSILMTSAAPSEGKSTLAMALAMELAAGRGMRVLLVDTDMRRGHLHRSFGVDAMPGLSDLLAGTCAFEDAVRPTATPGLSCLPHGGPMTATHGEGVGRAVVDLARSSHDVVVFDGLPVLASGRALSLAREVERVVLVARWARTRLNSVELAAEQLQIVRRDRTLVAVNGVDPRRHALYGYKDADFFLKALRQYQQGGAA
jgi:Mrp family chromosome partitioning ATPase